ncbi:unnamed protein product [Mucor fragilis]
MSDNNNDKSLLTKAFDATGGMLQSFTPIKQIHQHVCGLHFYANDKKRSVEAHHYCTHVGEDMHQCVIYDSDSPNAKLIGIEYIITKKKFDNLPVDEKKYWHSHVYEVKSGTLFMPFSGLIPKTVQDTTELKEMEHLINTYGKTYHFWQVDRGDEIPLGEPQLMMAYTKDGQIPEEKTRSIEKKFGISVQEKRKQREGITYQEPDVAADVYAKI